MSLQRAWLETKKSFNYVAIANNFAWVPSFFLVDYFFTSYLVYQYFRLSVKGWKMY